MNADQSRLADNSVSVPSCTCGSPLAFIWSRISTGVLLDIRKPRSAEFSDLER